MLHHMLRAAAGAGADKFVSFDGTNDYISTPDAAPLRVTGDIDLRVDVLLDDWTPAVSGFFIGKDNVDTQRSYDFTIQPDGTLRFLWFSGGSVKFEVSTVATSAAPGERLQVRTTLDVNNGASGRDVNFFIRPSGTELNVDAGWTQLGATVTTSGTTSIDAAAAELSLGAFVNGTSGFLGGDLYGAVIKDGINGTTVAVFDPNDASVGDTSVVDSDTALVWTINGGTSVSA